MQNADDGSKQGRRMNSERRLQGPKNGCSSDQRVTSTAWRCLQLWPKEF